MPGATAVSNTGGRTLVANPGSNDKFLGATDMNYRNKKLRDFRYRPMPVFGAVSALQVPAAVWLFGTAFIGLPGLNRHRAGG